MPYEERAMKVRPVQNCLHDLVMKSIILLLLCCHGSEFLTIQRERLEAKLLYDVLAALERTGAFFEEDYGSLNVDGLFGIRLCEGSIVGSLKDCSSSKFRCPTDLTKRLEVIKSKLSETGDRALPYVQVDDPKYFRLFLQTIDAPYAVQYIDERLGDDGTSPGVDTAYDEEKGDECYSQMMGTFSSVDKSVPKCTVTDGCWKYITRPNTASYAITHQLLYLIVAEKTGCLHELDKYFKKDNFTTVRDVERNLCRKIYQEARHEENGGHVPILSQDLFLEQGVLCGILGFTDFVSSRWIHMVLGWQNANGCFTLPSVLVTIQKELSNVQESQRQLLDLLNAEAKHIDQNYPVWRSRQLMREKTMNGDCLAHKTGLGVGVLGVYTRQLLRRIYSV